MCVIKCNYFEFHKWRVALNNILESPRWYFWKCRRRTDHPLLKEDEQQEQYLDLKIWFMIHTVAWTSYKNELTWELYVVRSFFNTPSSGIHTFSYSKLYSNLPLSKVQVVVSKMSSNCWPYFKFQWHYENLSFERVYATPWNKNGVSFLTLNYFWALSFWENRQNLLPLAMPLSHSYQTPRVISPSVMNTTGVMQHHNKLLSGGPVLSITVHKQIDAYMPDNELQI